MKPRRLVIAAALLASSTIVLAAENTTPAAASFNSVATSALDHVLRDLGYEAEARKAFPFIPLGQTIDESKHGDASRSGILLSCAVIETWSIRVKEQDEAVLVAGLCDRKSELTPELLATAKQAQTQMIDVLVKHLPKESVPVFMGLEPQRDALGALASEYLQIPFISEGGMAILPTLIVDASDGRRALVLQSFPDPNNCRVRPASVMCKGQKEWMQRVAVKIAEELRMN
jgi:hypothetical protein